MNQMGSSINRRDPQGSDERYSDFFDMFHAGKPQRDARIGYDRLF